MTASVREMIARIDERTIAIKEKQDELALEVASLKNTRARLLGAKDFVIAGIALLGALFSVILNGHKIGALFAWIR